MPFRRSRLARFDDDVAVLGCLKGRLRRPLRGFALDPSCAGQDRSYYAIKARYCASVLWSRVPVIPLKLVPSETGGDRRVRGRDEEQGSPSNAHPRR